MSVIYRTSCDGLFDCVLCELGRWVCCSVLVSIVLSSQKTIEWKSVRCHLGEWVLFAKKSVRVSLCVRLLLMRSERREAMTLSLYKQSHWNISDWHLSYHGKSPFLLFFFSSSLFSFLSSGHVLVFWYLDFLFIFIFIFLCAVPSFFERLLAFCLQCLASTERYLCPYPDFLCLNG